MHHILPDRFILFRLVAKPDSPKMDKIPCNAQGEPINPHDPSQWMTHADASSRVTSAVSGVGFVLNGDGWWCIDLDNCRDMTTGGWTDAATLIYQSFPGCIGEMSVSKTGLHIYGKCDPSQLLDRRNKWDGWCEWYHTGRFIALGGGGLAPIGDAWVERDWTDQLLKLLPARVGAGETLPDGADPAYTGPDDDDVLIAMMLRSSSTAAKFGSGVTVADLWEARAPALSRAYPAYDGSGGFDHSSADAALMSHLAFWTGKDMPRMDRLFRRSALMRDKYEKRADYRRDTVQGAARICKAVYNRPAPVEAEIDGQRKSRFFCAASLTGKVVPPRGWLVQDLVPSRTVTLLGGDGGTGKSLLALQLACAVAKGGAWIGRSVAQGGALFISAEDDEDELHRRLVDVARASGITLDNLKGLTLRSLAGEDALLATLDRSGGVLRTSPLFSEIDRRISEDCPALVVLDTLADLFPGNENDRAQARHFIGILRGIANRHGCAVLLLAHPSLSGLNTGSGTSGSTAWNNSVRSRLYLDRMADNPDGRLLSTKKANYWRIGEQISMTWRNGVFVADSILGPNGKIADEAKAEHVFLRLLDDFTKEGRTVKSAQAHGYAPKAFAASGRTEGISKQALHAAMERLFARGAIVETLGGHSSPSKQTLRIVRANVVAGAEPILNPC